MKSKGYPDKPPPSRDAAGGGVALRMDEERGIHSSENGEWDGSGFRAGFGEFFNFIGMRGLIHGHCGIGVSLRGGGRWPLASRVGTWWVLLLVLLVGCGGGEDAENRAAFRRRFDGTMEKHRHVGVEADPWPCRCPHRDTVLRNGDFVKYVWQDSAYVVSVRFHGFEGDLPEVFHCPLDWKEVPRFYAEEAGQLFLFRGHGEVVREATACSAWRGRLRFGTIMVQRGDPCNMDFFAYKSPSDPGALYLRGCFDMVAFRDSGKSTWQDETVRLKLPKRLHQAGIKIVYGFQKGEVEVLFDSGERLVLGFPGGR